MLNHSIMIAIFLLTNLTMNVSAQTKYLLNNTSIFIDAGQGILTSEKIGKDEIDYLVDPKSQYPITVDHSTKNVWTRLPGGKLELNLDIKDPQSKLNLKKMYLDLSETKTFLEMNEFILNNKNEIHQLDTVSADCHTNPIWKQMNNNNSFFINLLINCLEESKVTVHKGKIAKSLDFDNLNLNAKNNVFNLRANLNKPVNGTAKINGNSHFNPLTNLLTIEIKSAKIEFISIRGQLFKELKKSETDQFKVKEPFIYYNLTK